MIQQSFEQIVASLAAKTPTPGGGAAAALAGSMGAALFLMVVRYSRGKKANVAREGDLQVAETKLEGQVKALLPMAEADCKSFDAVSAALAMPKETDTHKAARHAALQRATQGAMVVPEQTLDLVRTVCATVQPVVGCISKTIASDLAAGAALMLAAAEGAFLNVKINAQGLDDKVFAAAATQRTTAVLQQVRDFHKATVATVDALLA